MSNYDKKAELLPTLWEHFYKQFGEFYISLFLYIFGCLELLQNNLIWEADKVKRYYQVF